LNSGSRCAGSPIVQTFACASTSSLSALSLFFASKNE
jgi:hypothetical protein